MTLEKKMTDYRTERDSIGQINVPKEKYWGAQTQRSLENFKIGSDKIPIFFIKAFAMQKKAAAISNIALEKLDNKLGQEIIKVCDEIIEGKLNDHFPLSVWQTGSGTQTNMNLNEVIANKGNQSLGKGLGEYFPIHPNDHCNMGQSSNDSFPTTMHIAISMKTNDVLFPAINNLIKTLEKKITTYFTDIRNDIEVLIDAFDFYIESEFYNYKKIEILKSKMLLTLGEIRSIIDQS